MNWGRRKRLKGHIKERQGDMRMEMGKRRVGGTCRYSTRSSLPLAIVNSNSESVFVRFL